MNHQYKSRLRKRSLAGLFAAVALMITSGPSATFTTVGGTVAAQEPKHMYTNKLIGETSPYLLQHAHNPVNWYPWGEEAFAKAKRENKPIFLSVGYSTCYWCHVMEVESFEKPEVAAVINKYFIAIKVDREERPDIDEQYMLATQMMTGRGGWPNSVWLTPDGKPWMAGTYFPKPRFISVLTQLNEFWVNRRDDVNRQADALEKAAKEVSARASAESVPLSTKLVTETTDKLLQQFDSANGGFGGAPKFPPHGTLALLIDQYQSTKDANLLPPITKTLDAMWLGGIHDHLGGGFHRYATDADWLLPHFEKMLYDNAQLMHLYADGFKITGQERYRDAVADIYRWVKREMTSPEGAFYSALDSGEVGKEGEAYIWSMGRLNQQLDKTDAALFATVYNFESEGNFREESTGEKSGENIPHLKQPIETIAEKHPLGKQAFLKQMAQIQRDLLANRLTWPQPHKDDKVLTSWNGLMIDSLAHAGRVLDEPGYVDAAAGAANFILNSMVVDGKLLRTYRAGKAKLPGYLDDHVFFAKGLIELYLATDDSRWLDEATRLADVMIDEFQDDQNGGFFFTGDNHEKLMVRSKQLGGGGNMPNTNGVAAQVLVALSQLSGKSRYRDAATKTLESLSGTMATQPHSSEHLLIAVSKYLSDTPSGQVDAVNETGTLTKRVDPITMHVSLSSDTVASGGKTTVLVTLDIDEGWHLYAKNPDAEFLIPTTISVSSETPITVGEMVTPESKTRTDPILKQPINTFSGKVSFKIPIQVGDKAKPGATTYKVTVKSQACDESRCLKPETATFDLSVKIID